jgi:hypothetical protein
MGLFDKVKKYGERKAQEFSTDNKRRKAISNEIKLKEREAYNREYAIGRVARAASEGRAAGLKPGFSLGNMGRIADNFSKAGNEMFELPKGFGPDKTLYNDMAGLPSRRQKQRSRRRRR